MCGIYLFVTSAVSWNYTINARRPRSMYGMKLVRVLC